MWKSVAEAGASVTKKYWEKREGEQFGKEREREGGLEGLEGLGGSMSRAGAGVAAIGGEGVR